ncbi:MAG: CBS domain-containing protein [Planctomycetes bacterium]|nr:CBS domain-containing protein [Planctomycetota bacterium]
MSTVEDILMAKGPDVIVTSRETTVHESVRLMCEANVGSVIVKDGDAVEGIFTERDLLRRVVNTLKDPTTTPLGDVMSSPVRSVELGMDVRQCFRLMTELRVRHLAVMEQDALVGMISLRDVLAAELQDDEEIIQEMEGQA